jgi:hypothetical protein
VRRRLPLFAALSPLALCACGDTLVGGDWLDELLGLEEVPAEVAWELRWYQGPGQPLLVECGLREPWTGHAELGEVYFGVTEIPTPEVMEAPEESTWIEGGGYGFAVALLVLVEPERYDRVDPEQQRTGLDPDRGVWGVVDSYALLIAEGDLERLAMDLMFEPLGHPMEPGPQLVGFLPEMVLGTGEFFGSLHAIEAEERAWLEEEGAPVVHLDYLDEIRWEVFEGAPMGGATTLDCGEER